MSSFAHRRKAYGKLEKEASQIKDHALVQAADAYHMHGDGAATKKIILNPLALAGSVQVTLTDRIGRR